MRVPVEDYVDNFREIARIATSHGAAVAIIGPVYRGFEDNPEEGARMTQQRDALRTAMQEAGIPYLEIPVITSYSIHYTKLYEAAHSDTFNPKSVDDGIASVTEKLSKRLAADGFVPGK